MKNLSKKECPYLPNRCTASIKTEDKSCYDVCNVYQKWDKLISKYIDSFDFILFDTKKVIEELNTIDGIVHRLNYWLKNYIKPLYGWINKLDGDWRDKQDLTSYQNQLKYWNHTTNSKEEEHSELPHYYKSKQNDFDLLYGDLSIPRTLFHKCFEEYENTPEFAFWYLKFSAENIFKLLIHINNWEQKSTSPLAKTLIQAEINELNAIEEKAKSFLLEKAFDIYREYHYHKDSNSIELLRIKGKLYEDYTLKASHSSKTIELYAKHILLKPYLQNLLANPNDTKFFLTGFDDRKLQETSSYYSYQRQITQDGYYKVSNLKVFTPELTMFLSSKNFTVENLDSNIITTIRGLNYIEFYTKGYKRGEAFFDKEFSVSNDVIFSDKAERYERTLHKEYFHTQHEPLMDGWQYVKLKFPLIITKKEVEKFGYYSGIVSKVDDLVKRHSALFKNFDQCDYSLTENDNNNPEESTKNTKTNNEDLEIKPIFNQDLIEDLHNILKHFFDKENHSILKILFETGNNTSYKLLFKDNGNRLADTFKQLIENDLITGCEKKDLEQWTINNFKYLYRNKAKDYKPDTIQKTISRKDYPCKKPIIEIINGKIHKI